MKEDKLKNIPNFASEEEERQFWLTHDSTEYIDWDKAQVVEFINLKRTEQEGIESEQTMGSSNLE